MNNNIKQVYSVEDFAKELGLSSITIRRYIKNGKIRANKLGKKYHIPKSELDKLLETEVTFATLKQDVPAPHREPKLDLKYNSLVGETLAEIAKDFKSVDEVEEVVTQLDVESLPILNKIREGKKDPMQVIGDFLGLEAQINLESRRRMVRYLQKDEALVFLPLPPPTYLRR